MSESIRLNPDRLGLKIPDKWQAFMNSGEYAGARVWIHAEGTEVPRNVVARLEFVDERSLVIHLALAEGDPPPSATSERGLVGILTPRERTVIALIAMGYETGEIADLLYVSSSTVRTHVRNSMSKLGAHTRAQLVAVAMENGEPLASTPEIETLHVPRDA